MLLYPSTYIGFHNKAVCCFGSTRLNQISVESYRKIITNLPQSARQKLNNKIEEISTDIRNKKDSISTTIININNGIKNTADFVVYLPNNVSSAVEETIDNYERIKVDSSRKLEEASKQVKNSIDFFVYLPSNVSDSIDRTQRDIVEYQKSVVTTFDRSQRELIQFQENISATTKANIESVNSFYESLVSLIAVFRTAIEKKDLNELLRLLPFKPSKPEELSRKNIFERSVEAVQAKVDSYYKLILSFYEASVSTVETVKRIPDTVEELKEESVQLLGELQSEVVSTVETVKKIPSTLEELKEESLNRLNELQREVENTVESIQRIPSTMDEMKEESLQTIFTLQRELNEKVEAIKRIPTTVEEIKEESIQRVLAVQRDLDDKVENVRRIPQTLEEIKEESAQRLLEAQKDLERRQQAARELLLVTWDWVTLKPVIRSFAELKSRIENLKSRPVPANIPVPSARIEEVAAKKVMTPVQPMTKKAVSKPAHPVIAAGRGLISFGKGVVSFAGDFQRRREANRERFGLNSQSEKRSKKTIAQVINVSPSTLASPPVVPATVDAVNTSPVLEVVVEAHSSIKNVEKDVEKAVFPPLIEEERDDGDNRELEIDVVIPVGGRALKTSSDTLVSASLSMKTIEP